MTLLLLGVFALIRFILMWQSKNIHVDDGIIAVLLLAIAVIVMVFVYLSGNLRNCFSFAYDVFLILIVGYFFWGLVGIEKYILLTALGLFIFLIIAAVSMTVKLFKLPHPSEAQRLEMVDIHEFINKCLGIKFIIMALGALAAEKIISVIF